MQEVTFFNKPELKEKYVKRAKKHYDADQIIQGLYWDGKKGCCVGCLAHKNDEAHCALEKQTAIPEWLSLLADRIHEGLTHEESKSWPMKFIDAIPVGVDLTPVMYKFKIWLLTDKHNGVIQWANEETKKIIKEIVRLQKKAAKGEEVDFSAARSAAESAARSARSTAWSAAESAAWSAWSAESAAGSAAESAAWSARSAGQQHGQHGQQQSQHTIKLFQRSYSNY